MALGYANPDQLAGEISERTYQEWVAYATLEPFGEDRADYRIAQLCALFANANRPKGRRAFRTQDFMPRFDKGVDRDADLEDDFKRMAKNLGVL